MKNTCVFICVWECCFSCRHWRLCQLLCTKCHSGFFPSVKAPATSAPTSWGTHTRLHTRTKAGCLKSTYTLLGNKVGRPLLACSCHLFSIFSFSLWRTLYDMKLMFFSCLVILTEWRLMGPLNPPTPPPQNVGFCWSQVTEVTTATAGLCATVNVLWPLCCLGGSWGRLLPWQHGHLTLAPNLPSSFLSTKTLRRHHCCCTRWLKTITGT